jgi:hypothetical protein
MQGKLAPEMQVRAPAGGLSGSRDQGTSYLM